MLGQRMEHQNAHHQHPDLPSITCWLQAQPGAVSSRFLVKVLGRFWYWSKQSQGSEAKGETRKTLLLPDGGEGRDKPLTEDSTLTPMSSASWACSENMFWAM